MLMVFGGLLAAVIGFQVYRGVVAFRNPDQELPSRRTPRVVWSWRSWCSWLPSSWPSRSEPGYSAETHAWTGGEAVRPPTSTLTGARGEHLADRAERNAEHWRRRHRGAPSRTVRHTASR